MVRVVVCNVKGGVGKTTTSVYLAAAAVARGYDPVLLIDADRQASSAEWLEERPVEGGGGGGAVGADVEPCAGRPWWCGSCRYAAGG